MMGRSSLLYIHSQSTKSDMIMLPVLLVCSQLGWLHIAYGHILRLPCLEFGNFSIVKADFRQNGTVLAAFANLSESECEDHCVKNWLCKSININNDTCELNSKSSEDPFDGGELSKEAGWTYKSTDYKELNIGYYCQELKPCPPAVQCTDSCHYPGYECQVTKYGGFQSCKEVYNSGIRETGAYSIHLPGFNAVEVRCDMRVDSGGWIVFQRRVDATVDFNRGWDDYKNGFGNPNGNFWLGLEKLHQLAAPGSGVKLRIDLQRRSSMAHYYAIYDTFEISDEADGYRITVDGFSGTATDRLKYHNKMKFSTKDRDNDKNSNGNCAKAREGAWWFKSCYRSHLNGRHPNRTGVHGVKKLLTWRTFTNDYGGWTMSEMKLKKP